MADRDGILEAAKRLAGESLSGVQREVEKIKAEANTPGPNVPVAPIQPGGFSYGTALAKLGTALFSAARSRANYKAKLATQEEDILDRQARRKYLIAQAAHAQAQADEKPEETLPITVSASGDLVPADLTGPAPPGSQTLETPKSKYLERISSLGRAADTGTRSDRMYDLAVHKQQLAEEAGGRAEKRLGMSEDYHKVRMANEVRRAAELKLPTLDREALERLRYDSFSNHSLEPAKRDAEKRAYLNLAQNSANDPEAYFRSLMSIVDEDGRPWLASDPDIIKAASTMNASGPAAQEFVAAVKAAQEKAKQASPVVRR